MANSDQSADKSPRILQAIYSAFDDLNATLPQEDKIKKSEDTVLLGPAGGVDSLRLTMLVVAIEQKIEDEFDEVIVLVDSSTMSLEHSPFRQVKLLVEHISNLLDKKINATS